MSSENLSAVLTAVFFAAGEPLEAEKIAAALDLEKKTVIEACSELALKLENENIGLRLLNLDGKYQMTTQLEYAEKVRRVLEVKRNAPLSPAAFEVLAVVAYNQPTTKAFVEQVRGVDCGGVMNSLMQKGLIEECGRLDLPGKPLVYATTVNFLRCFCLESLADLPKLPEKEPVQLNEPEKAQSEEA